MRESNSRLAQCLSRINEMLKPESKMDTPVRHFVPSTDLLTSAAFD
jgi:hypothetical protein